MRARSALLATACLSAFAFAETPTFDVASVKINHSGERAAYGQSSLASGRYNFLNTPMRSLIMWAYHVRKDYITGGPNWLESERYDVIAQAPPKTPLAEVRLMLRSLLADRFKLRVRETRKIAPVFVLVAAVGGASLHPASGSGQPECRPGQGVIGLVHIECTNLTMEDLADYLQDLAPRYIDRPVVDATQLKGAYDLKLDWAPQPPAPDVAANPGGSTPDLSTGPTIFDEMQRQFGLTLKPGKRPMRIIIVDHIERNPIDN